MRTINKGPELSELADWKQANPHKKYKDLETSDTGVRRAIRKHALEEQFYLCAYCCQRIEDVKTSCHNEHVEAQSLNPKRTLDFANIVASCNTHDQCGNAH